MYPTRRDEFTIAMICALVEEANAVEAIFDEMYDSMQEKYGRTAGDRNSYLNGRIGKHNVVVCYMPGMGKSSAAMVASDLRFSYTKIEMDFVVGICAGVPETANGQKIFLGDTIISNSVIEYDFGKQYPNGFQRKRGVLDTLGRPSPEIRARLVALSGDRTSIEFQRKMAMHAQKVQPVGSKWRRPASDDILFNSTYAHKHYKNSKADSCLCLSDHISDAICEGAMRVDCTALGCDESEVRRRRTQTDMGNAVIHIGPIASADTVMKSGIHRDQLAHAEGIIALEMEGAGVWDNFPCIIIKGVCDYADSHKDSKWQLYAAANAAATVKAFLEYLNNDTKIESSMAKTDKQVQWTVPFRRNPKFVGRRVQLEQLRALMSDPNGPRELAITGLGGVGKTAVAIELAYQLRDADPDCSIFWIPCTSQASVEQAYSDIARRLRLPDQTDVKTMVKDYLSQTISEKWILIFDNADSEHMWMKDDNALRDFVPDNECGRTLFTSRNGQLAIDLADSNIVKVVEFDLETAMEFLQRSLLQQDLLNDHKTVLLLLSKLTFLPLAITQAVAFINRNQISLSTYIEILDKQEMEMIELLSENFQDKWRYKDVQNPVASTWWISFQQIQQSNPLAADYLSFMSCIDPRNIPQFILPPATSKNEKIKAIGLLKSYAFVTGSETAEDKLLNLHRLVYIATRNYMRKSLTLEDRMFRTFAQLESIVLSGGPGIPVHQKAKSLRGVYNHIITLLREECIRREQIKNHEFLGQFLHCLVYDFRLIEAEDLCIQFIQISSTQEGFDYGTLYILECLITILAIGQRQRKMKKVLDPFIKRLKVILDQFSATIGSWIPSPTTSDDEKVGEFTSAILETREPDIFAILNYQRIIAMFFRVIDRLTVSEALFQFTIRISQLILGPDHPNTLLCQRCLATQYHELQQNTRAEKIYLQLINTTKSAIRPDQKELLEYEASLAEVYCDESRYAEAEKCYLQAISLSEVIHGPNDLKTLNFQFCLAVMYQNQSRYHEAEDIMLRVIQMAQLVHEAGSSLFVSGHMAGLVKLYHDWGDFDKAERASTQFIHYSRFTEKHPSTMSDTELMSQLRAIVARMRDHAKRPPPINSPQINQ